MKMKMSRYFKLIVLVAIILISEKSLLAERRSFHSEKNVYSSAIPSGWVDVPNDVLRQSVHALLSGQMKQRMLKQCEVAFQLKADHDMDAAGPGFWERRAMEAAPIIALTLIVAFISAMSGGISGIIKRHKDKKATEQLMLRENMQLSEDNER